jgi:protein-tyrosine phosphatase
MLACGVEHSRSQRSVADMLPLVEEFVMGMHRERPILEARNVIAKVLPERWVSRLRQYRGFQTRERRVFLRAWVLDGLGIERWRRPVPANVRSFVFVCHGNIMRSPMCEALLKSRLSALTGTHFTIASAGLHAQAGSQADRRARVAAPEFGVSLEQHRSKPLTAEMVEQADVVFGMDSTNHVELLTNFPDARKKMYLLSAYSNSEQMDIPDPYTEDDAALRHCYAEIDLCIRNLAQELSRSVVSGADKGGTRG